MLRVTVDSSSGISRGGLGEVAPFGAPVTSGGWSPVAVGQQRGAAVLAPALTAHYRTTHPVTPPSRGDLTV